jgi:hypothetical protein
MTERHTSGLIEKRPGRNAIRTEPIATAQIEKRDPLQSTSPLEDMISDRRQLVKPCTALTIVAGIVSLSEVTGRSS